ncbi:MAG: hypothetical protein N2746_08310 [Deltaproteobacteria bacterium]|nr:hypothetical protein [Deltaproteobacteria bacterium]
MYTKRMSVVCCAACIFTFLVNLSAQEFGAFGPKVSFSEKTSMFLSIYANKDKDTKKNGLYGVFIDRRGNVSQPFQISKNFGQSKAISYLSSSNVFLLVYSYCDLGCLIEGQIILPDGTLKGTPFIISSNSYGFGEIVAESDESSKKFLIVWKDYRNRSNHQVFGRLINDDGTMHGPEIQIIKNANSVTGFDIVRDSINNRYLFVYSDADVNLWSINALSLRDNLSIERMNKIATSSDFNCKVSISFDSKNKLFFIAYSNFLPGVNSFNIEALVLDEDLKVLYNIDVTTGSNQNRFPDTAYNPFADAFVITYHTKRIEGTISNIAFALYKAIDGSLIDTGIVDKTGMATLLNPSIAVNSICPNGVIVYENYDASTFTNNFGAHFLGELCKFHLSISKKGDGSGKVHSEPAGIDCGGICSYQYKDGSSVTLIATPDESSTFVGFSAPQCGDEAVCSISIDSDKKIDAEFALKTFQIKTVAGNGGQIFPENPIVKYGSDQKVDIIPYEGYVIDEVIIDNQSYGVIDSYTFTNVISDHTISATFQQEPIYYAINASASEGGNINPAGEIKVRSGDSITFTITPLEGYFINYVEVDGNDVGAINEYTFSNVDNNHTIYANFKSYQNEWDFDGGVSEVLNGSGQADSNVMVTVVKEKEGSGCSCSLIE